MIASRTSAGAAFALAVLVAACGDGPRPYAAWSGPKMSAQVGCVELDAWISKSGKEGVGVTVAVRASDREGSGACHVEIKRAAVAVAGAVHAAVRLPPAPDLHAGARAFLYAPIPFDNNTAWNDEARDGKLLLGVVASGEAREVALEWAIAQREQSTFACPDSQRPPRPPPREEAKP